MMSRSCFCLFVFAFGVFFLISGGCATTPQSRFYSLRSVSDSATKERNTTSLPHLSLGVGPVQIPEYLNRPQIVTRTGRNELHLAEFNQWAESLRDNFSRVLAENLSIMLAADHVFVFPWESFTPTIRYQVTVDVYRFEGNADGRAVLVARWSILEENNKVLLTRKSDFSEPWVADNYENLVEALNRTVGDLSKEIASAIGELSEKRTKPMHLKTF